MIDAGLRFELEQFLYREARLADESRYAEWEALWTGDEGLYWVPSRPDVDPATQVSHIYDNRARIATRVRQLCSGSRYSQLPVSPMRRVLSNIEMSAIDDGYELAANVVLYELAIQTTRDINIWVGRAVYRVRRVDDDLRMFYKRVDLINAAEPIPNLAFLL